MSVNLVPLLLTGVRLHPPGRTDKILCRFFGAPALGMSAGSTPPPLNNRAFAFGRKEEAAPRAAFSMLVLAAFPGTGYTAAAARSRHTLRTLAARAVLDAYNGPHEVVAERAYGGPHEADVDWAKPYEGPREADADWVTPYEGPHNAAGVWSSPSVLSLSPMDPSLRSPLSVIDATMVDGVPVSSFHSLFGRCYEPAAPGCVRRSGSRPVPHLPSPARAPREPACLVHCHGPPRPCRS